MNVVFVVLFLMLVSFLFKLPGKIHFNNTKDEIDNEELKEEYLHQKYTNQYPEGKIIEINRPKKEYGYWVIVIDLSNFFDIRVNRGKLIEKKIIFWEGTHNKIKQEIHIQYDKKKEQEIETMKNWDEEGNEIKSE
tara:strand:+ start:56 stop:460 length:405 start_codon:yes stop_codon:yes gene_type:complete